MKRRHWVIDVLAGAAIVGIGYVTGVLLNAFR